LELSPPGNEVTRWEVYDSLDATLHLADDRPHVAPPDEDSDGRDTHSRFAADVHAPAPDGHRRGLIERNAQPRGGVDEDAADRINIASRFSPQADDDAESLFSFPDLGRRL